MCWGSIDDHGKSTVFRNTVIIFFFPPFSFSPLFRLPCLLPRQFPSLSGGRLTKVGMAQVRPKHEFRHEASSSTVLLLTPSWCCLFSLEQALPKAWTAPSQQRKEKDM